MKKTFENDYEASLEVAAAVKAALDEISDTVEGEEISELVAEANDVIYDIENEIYAAEEEDEEIGFIFNPETLTRDTFESPLDAAEFACKATKALIEVTGSKCYDTAFYKLIDAIKNSAAC